MRSQPSLAHRLRCLVQGWLDVSPYTVRDFGAVGQSANVDPGVHISDPRCVFLGERSVIYRGCTVLTGPGALRLGPGSHLAGGVYVNALRGGVRIGCGTAIGPGTVLLSYSNAVIPGRTINEARETGEVIIGDDVFIGAGVTVLPGVRIGDGAVVGAGAVVRRNVAAREIVGGVPARCIGVRSCDPEPGDPT